MNHRSESEGEVCACVGTNVGVVRSKSAELDSAGTLTVGTVALGTLRANRIEAGLFDASSEWLLG